MTPGLSSSLSATGTFSLRTAVRIGARIVGDLQVRSLQCFAILLVWYAVTTSAAGGRCRRRLARDTLSGRPRSTSREAAPRGADEPRVVAPVRAGPRRWVAYPNVGIDWA